MRSILVSLLVCLAAIIAVPRTALAAEELVITDVYAEPDLTVEARAVTLLLRSMLSTGRKTAVPRQRLAKVLADITGQSRRVNLIAGWRITDRVVQGLGAEYLVSSALRREGTRTVLTVRIANARGDSIAVVSSRAAYGDITGLAAEAARRVATVVEGEAAEHFVGSLGDLEPFGLAMLALNMNQPEMAAYALFTADPKVGRTVHQAQLTAREVLDNTRLPLEMRCIAAYATGDARTIEGLVNPFLAASLSNPVANSALAWSYVVRRNFVEAEKIMGRIKRFDTPFVRMSRMALAHGKERTAERDKLLTGLLKGNPYLPALRFAAGLAPGSLPMALELRLLDIADRLKNAMPALSTDLALRAAQAKIQPNRALGIMDIGSMDLTEIGAIMPLLEGKVEALAKARASQRDMAGGVEASLAMAWAPAVVMQTEALLRMDKLKEASAKLDSIVAGPALEPNADALVIRGRMLMQDGQPTAAATSFDQAAQVVGASSLGSVDQPLQAAGGGAKAAPTGKTPGTAPAPGGGNAPPTAPAAPPDPGVLVLATGNVNMSEEEAAAMDGLGFVTDKTGIEMETAQAFEEVGLDPNERAGDEEANYLGETKAAEGKNAGSTADQLKGGEGRKGDEIKFPPMKLGGGALQEQMEKAKREQARALDAGGDPTAAQNVVVGLGENANSAESHVAIAKTMMQNGKPEMAVNRLEAAATVAPDSPEVYEALADAYTATGNTAEAERARKMAKSLADGRAPPPMNVVGAAGVPGTTAGAGKENERVPPKPPTDSGVLQLAEKLEDPVKKLKLLTAAEDETVLIVELTGKGGIMDLKYTNPEPVGQALLYVLQLRPMFKKTKLHKQSVKSLPLDQAAALATAAEARFVMTYEVGYDEDDAVISYTAIEVATGRMASGSVNVPGHIADLVSRRFWHLVVGGICGLVFAFVFLSIARVALSRSGDVRVLVENGPDLKEDVFMLKITKRASRPSIGEIKAWSKKHHESGRKEGRRTTTVVNQVNTFTELSKGTWYVHLLGTYQRDEDKVEVPDTLTKMFEIRKNETTQVHLLVTARTARYRIYVKLKGSPLENGKVWLDDDTDHLQHSDKNGRTVFDVPDGQHTFHIETGNGKISLPVTVTQRGSYRLEHDYQPVAATTGAMDKITLGINPGDKPPPTA